jgi:DNA-binding MarR family transcriptional regulator
MIASVERQSKAAPVATAKLKLRLWLRLLRTSRAIEGELRERLRVAFKVTLPQFDVLAALARQEAGMTMSELSRFLMVSNGNVTGIIDRLVVERMVIRIAKQGDRRTTFVRLTRDGATRFSLMARAHEGWIAELLSDLSREDAEQMIGLLGAASRGIANRGT